MADRRAPRRSGSPISTRWRSAGIRFGLASAYSVILFIIMMSMGYFYVRALDGGDGRTAGRRAPRIRPAPGGSTRWRDSAGWECSSTLLPVFATLPMVWMFITSIKTQFAALQYPPEWWPRNPTLGSYTAPAARPPAMSGSEFLTLHAEQRLGVIGDHGPRRDRRGAGGVCILALPLSRAQDAVLLGPDAQHVPGASCS